MRTALACVAVCGFLVAGCAETRGSADELPHVAGAATPEEAGRYVMTIGGCHDCHTPDFLVKGWEVPEATWLTGSPVGWRGPWGTSYAPNLRLTVQDMTEDQWVEMLRTRTALPPMPWMNVNRMSEPDMRAVYRYLRSLGPAGERMPVAVTPDQEPTTPFFLLEPQGLP
jgi:hypothetical protein